MLHGKIVSITSYVCNVVCTYNTSTSKPLSIHQLSSSRQYTIILTLQLYTYIHCPVARQYQFIIDLVLICDNKLIMLLQSNFSIAALQTKDTLEALL